MAALLVLALVANTPEGVVVGTLTGDNLAPGRVERIQSTLLTALAQLEGVDAVSIDRVRSLSPEARIDRAACLARAGCREELHQRTGAVWVVSGELTGDALTLRRSSLVDGTAGGAVTCNVGASDAASLEAVRGAVARLFGTSTRTSPGEPALTWQPDPGPLHPAVFVTGAVLTLAAAGVGALFLAEAGRTEDAYWVERSSPTPDADRAQGLLVQQSQQALVSLVAFSSAGALALASLVVALFTDWGPDALEPSIRLPGPGALTLSLAGARWRW